MTSEEVVRVVRIAAKFGVKYVKLTGGEPLLRKDIVGLVQSITNVSGIVEVSMTTNATRLATVAEELRNAGLRRININLPTLHPSRYTELTGGDINDAIEGIRAAVKAGLSPIKLNMLILRGVNDQEIDAMLNFCKEQGFILQLIELEPVNISKSYYDRYHVSLKRFEERFEEKALRIEKRRFMQNRRIYYLPDVTVELVPPIENSEFCLHCTRIRLTSDGKLKPCLMRNDNLVDILTPMRKGVR
jgi:cyclic pyranopterin phosphate synthase